MNIFEQWADYCGTNAARGTDLQAAAWFSIYMLTALALFVPIVLVTGALIYWMSTVPYLLLGILIAALSIALWIVRDQL